MKPPAHDLELLELERVVEMAWDAGFFDDCLFSWRPWQQLPDRPLLPHERPFTRAWRRHTEALPLLDAAVDRLLGPRFLLLLVEVVRLGRDGLRDDVRTPCPLRLERLP